MSWSQSVPDVTLDELKECEPTNFVKEHGAEQFEAARAAAVSIIESGATGDPEQYSFNVLLSGHANPDHEPRDGWGNDSVAVSVAQGVPVKPAQEAEAEQPEG